MGGEWYNLSNWTSTFYTPGWLPVSNNLYPLPISPMWTKLSVQFYIQYAWYCAWAAHILLQCQGRNCVYNFTSRTPNTVQDIHTIPETRWEVSVQDYKLFNISSPFQLYFRYVDDLTFTMANNGSGCSIDANSLSQAWFVNIVLKIDEDKGW